MSKYEDVNVRVVRARESSMLVQVETDDGWSDETWIPRSQIEDGDVLDFEPGDEDIIGVARWLLRDRGIL